MIIRVTRKPAFPDIDPVREFLVDLAKGMKYFLELLDGHKLIRDIP